MVKPTKKNIKKPCIEKKLTRSKINQNISKKKSNIKETTKVILKKRRQNYAISDLEKAKKSVLDGNSVYKAAEIFGVPSSTLSDHVLGKSKSTNIGASTYLDQDVETLLVEAILCLSKWGFGLNFTHMKSIVKDYLSHTGKENKFKVNC